jgi:hypothetical protein
MSSEIKLWHLAVEEPPGNIYILIMCAMGEYGLRYEVEYTPHIANWGMYIEYHSVVAWCAITDIHKFGVAVPEISEAIYFELKKSLNTCKEGLTHRTGTAYYQSYAVNAEWLLTLIKILKELKMDFPDGMENLIGRVTANRDILEDKVLDFEIELKRRKLKNYDYGKYINKLRMLKMALVNLQQAEFILADLNFHK